MNAPVPAEIVTDMLVHGAELQEVERFIDRLPIPEDHRSALWLLAWLNEPDAAPDREPARVP